MRGNNKDIYYQFITSPPEFFNFVNFPLISSCKIKNETHLSLNNKHLA